MSLEATPAAPLPDLNRDDVSGEELPVDGWTALALLRAGMRVTLVDAWGAGNARASSGGETRVIRAVYNGVPLYSEMVARAFVLWPLADVAPALVSAEDLARVRDQALHAMEDV